MNNSAATEMVTITREEYERLQAQSEHSSELEKRVELLMEALRLARHKQYGASSEKSDDALVEQLSLLFNEAEVYAETKAEDDSATVVAAHSRHKKHEYTLDNIPEGVATEKVEHRLEGEDLICPECGSTMTEIGKTVVKTLKLVSVQTIVREDIYYTYACQNCAKNGTETPIVKAPVEKNIIPGSFASPEAIAHIATQKFVMGSPLYRQEQELYRMGIPLSRQTMSNWLMTSTEKYLMPVYEWLHRDALTREILHADETVLQVLHEEGKKPQSESYMWLYRTSGDTQKPIVLFEYRPGRSSKYPQKFLAGFHGYLHTDGYAGYHNLPDDIIVVGCWIHARRKFDEAMKSLPKEKAKGSSAAQGMAYCNKLLDIEKELAEMTAEERYNERLKRSKPVLDAMLSWVSCRTASPKSALGKAYTYLKNQWPYLTNYLKDGRLECSNNRAERTIKPFVIARKNFLFANTPRGAANSAVIFSIIRTATENHLDPYRYLVWLFKTAKDADLTNPETLENLLPWNAPAACKVN